MVDSTIYTIGHGNKSAEKFLSELMAFKINYLLDIRSKPYSKWNPHFNKDEIRTELIKNGITYVFVGDALGGLPKDTTCYDHNGKVVYDFIKEKAFFLNGLKRLEIAHKKKIHLALMCSETKPEECHRSKLIGQELLKKNICLKHIVSQYSTKSQQAVMNELTKGVNTVDLFGNEVNFTSRKSY